ncbi:immunoglobulin superfamily member 8 [Hyperolius riggenbachi]|uniref:immunoglobulin superfamily member 8 n=1 Tax=Hyperolius riggenbachi TaxID=752182 RepID=UPI0035A3AEF0
METARISAVVFLLLFVTGFCSSREVRIQEGPLYRVVDNPISIHCNVSDYEGPSTQNFEWFMYRPDAPDISISIASTKDPNFPYALFSARVKKGDIYIQRLSGDSAELHMKWLRPEDEGVYECYTPTTDSKYLGSYSAKTTLKVIPDTLQVSAKSAGKGRTSAQSPLQLTLVEGRELHLSCMALSDSAQHTHLSVAFSVSDLGTPVGRGTLRNVISLQKDFSVDLADVHAAYTNRYLNGEIRVEKSDNSTYKIVISRVRPQDAGSYHCTAAQWIQDLDGSWQKITEKRSVLAQVTVQPIDSQLKVVAGPQEVHVQSGNTVELFCNVSLAVPPPPDMMMSVEWWVTTAQESPGQLVASMGTDGLVSLGERYTGGDVGTRHISLEKLPPSPGSFRLRIYSTQPGDIGAYSCRVKTFVCYPGARLEEVSSRVSQSMNVLMRVQDISLNVYTYLDMSTLYRGDTAILLCNVSVETPQTVHVAVSWWVELAGEQPNERTGRLLASVNRQGVSEAGTRYSGEELSTDKVAPQCYRIRLYNIRPEDEGMYHCAVTAWIQYPDRTWYNAASAKSNVIKIYPYAQAKDLLLIPMIGGVASALFVGITILSTVTCCYLRQLRQRKR